LNVDKEDKINGLIYVFENKENHKLYVGQTTKLLKQRINGHISQANQYKKLNKNHKFYNALNKYGKKGFHIYTIDKSDTLKGLNHKEKEWIKILKSVENGYNNTDGGKNGKLSEEIIKKRRKKVICLDTNEIFNSIEDASKKYNLCASRLSEVCNGKGYKAGNKEWSFYSDYCKGLKNKKRKYRKIICLETNEVFNTIAEISKKYNIDYSNINDYIHNHDKRTICNGFHFIYYDEFLEKGFIKKHNFSHRKIRCTETGEIFESIADASRKFHIDYDVLQYRIRNKSKKGIRFEYIDKSNEKIIDKKKDKRYSPVKCLETDEVFDTLIFATRKYKISPITLRKRISKKLTVDGLTFEYLNKEIENSDTNILEVAI